MASRKGGQRILVVLFVVFACVFVVSAGMFGWNLYERKQEADAFAALRAQQEAQRAVAAQDAANAAAALAAGYDNLHNQNPDYAAWLTVGGTAIDYPVMWTPNEPEYYLRRAFNKSSAATGTPFIGEGSDIDSDCLIIYGHEMNDGSMFGELDKYADASFAAQKQPITITTRTEMRTYEVFAAVKTSIPPAGSDAFRYYNSAGPLDQAGFDALLAWFKANALYDTGVTPTFGQQILILSTCSYHTDNGRFVVAARRVS